MTRGTTPTLNFTLPFTASQLTECEIAFAQCGSIVLTKDLTDCTTALKVLTVVLTEDETLLFDSTKPLEIQIRCAISDSVMASQIIRTPVGRILRDGEL